MKGSWTPREDCDEGDMLERLARIEHERWAHWQAYVHEKGVRQPDGGLLIPADLVGQWDRQIATDYSALSEKEKESDRDQVRRYLPLLMKAVEGEAGRGAGEGEGEASPKP